ncbi:MAG TPA: guanylate kinase [Pyrinomonadaceae bacterium]|nr:guanylate kinase [Pyrinomonadaceae bacterium]HMP66720.1 guanylate kinase [Pyrinomonadaceae bacterium]
MIGNLIVISSPSGGGKGTLIREVLHSIPDVGYSVSYTTREPRFGEEDGREYHFISKLAFFDMVDNGEFLEYAEVHGNMYGTSKKQIKRVVSEGRDVILEIDVQGAVSVMEQMPEAVTIFILPPSFEVLRARLTARNTEDADDLALRLRNSFDEVMHYERFEYVIINDELPTAARMLGAVICAERQRRIRQTEPVQDILDSFAQAKHSIAGD